MGIFTDAFKRNMSLREIPDLNFEFETTTASRVYLKRIALETCINFIARTVSQSEFWIKDGDKRIKNSTLNYRLNVRPNTDSSASDFWHKVIYRLVYDNEVLIIKNDSDDLVIADDFQRVEYAMYDDMFKDVVIKDYQYKRSFNMSEVIYLSYNNDKLMTFVNGLFNDYGELFGRMMDSQLRNHQLRALLRIKNGGGDLSSQQRTKLNKLAEKMYGKLKTDSVAIIPEIAGFEYQEISDGSRASSSSEADNIQKMKKVFIEDVAKIIGIPPPLIHGDMADLSNLMDAYLKFCINPLLKKIEDEFNNKLFSKNEHLSGKRIEIVGINKRDPINHSEAIDKLVASGAFNRNEIRSMFGFETKEGLDEFLVTKNYDKDEALKGGENE